MATLAEINKTLQENNKVLDSANEVLQRILQEDEAARKDAAAAAERASRQAKEDAKERRRQQTQPQNTGGFVSGVREGVVGATGLGMLGAWGERIASALFGGASVAAITTAVGRMVGRGLIFGGVAALVGRFGEDIVRDLFEQADITIPQTALDNIAEGATTSIQAGLLAGVFNKKLGIGVALGGLVGTAITSFLDEEENQRVIATAFGQEITSEQAIQGAMMAAGGVALLAGPMAGIAAALLGLGVVAGERMQRWIEAKRAEAIDAITNELDTRLEEGNFEAGEAGLFDTIANAMGLNIQDDSIKSADALLTEMNARLNQTLRQQQAAAGMMDEFAGFEGAGVMPTEIDMSQLDDDTRQAIEQAQSTLDSIFEENRMQLGDWTEQSLRNLRQTATTLGRDDIITYINNLLEARRTGGNYNALPEGPTQAEINRAAAGFIPEDMRRPDNVVESERIGRLADIMSGIDRAAQLAYPSIAGGVGAQFMQPVINYNNIDNSSTTSANPTIRYDNSMSPYDMDAYMRRGIAPPGIQ